MKLAYLINQYPQPSQSFIRREIAALEQMGVGVERFTLRQWNGKLVDDAGLEEQRRTRVVLNEGAAALAAATVRMMLRHPCKFAAAARIAWRLGKKGARGRFVHLIYLSEACLLAKWLAIAGAQHLHAHFGTNSATVAMLCRSLGGPAFSFTVHGPEEFDQPVALALGEKVARSAFTVAVSEFGRSQLYRWCDARHWSKIHVIRCGVDELFLTAARQIAAAQPSGTSAQPLSRRLVCVGRLAEQKGQIVLLQAAAELTARGIDFDLLLIGDGPMRSEIERQIAKLNLGTSVRVAGWLSNDHVRLEMLAARAVVLPSFAEGLPVVLMEALALGRPVIATHVAGIPELVDCQCGGLVAPGDVGALAGAIERLLSTDIKETQALAAEGAMRILRMHDASREAHKLQQLFVAALKAAHADTVATADRAAVKGTSVSDSPA